MQPLDEYLVEAFKKNTPWDQVATAFITATGDVRENGATAIIMAQMGETSDITAEVSRIFLGIQIQCAQCHDHPTDRWKRTQFHELAAFFPRIGVRPKQAEVRSFEVVSVDREPRIRRPNNGRPRGNRGTFYAGLGRSCRRTARGWSRCFSRRVRSWRPARLIWSGGARSARWITGP